MATAEGRAALADRTGGAIHGEQLAVLDRLASGWGRELVAAHEGGGEDAVAALVERGEEAVQARLYRGSAEAMAAGVAEIGRAVAELERLTGAAAGSLAKKVNDSLALANADAHGQYLVLARMINRKAGGRP